MEELTLKKAIELAMAKKSDNLCRAATILIGCHYGGYGAPLWEWNEMMILLPGMEFRNFTTEEWVDAVYEVDRETNLYKSLFGLSWNNHAAMSAG